MLLTRHQRIIDLLGNVLDNYDSGHRVKHVAALVRRNKIVSMGFNSLKTSPRVLQYSKSVDRVCIHAEVDAIHRVADTVGLDLYVIRKNRNGEWADSCPCKDCIEAIDKTGIRRVIYTTYNAPKVIAKNELCAVGNKRTRLQKVVDKR